MAPATARTSSRRRHGGERGATVRRCGTPPTASSSGASSPRATGRNEFDRLEAAASTGRLAFDIAVARIAGRFRPVGSLHIGRQLPPELDALRFNPSNTGGGMEPAGWLNGARDRAYKLSQAAWRRTRRDGAALQDLADRELTRRELAASARHWERG